MSKHFNSSRTALNSLRHAILFLAALLLQGRQPASAEELRLADEIPASRSVSAAESQAGVPDFQFGSSKAELVPLSQIAGSSLETSAWTGSEKLSGATAVHLRIKNNSDRPLSIDGNSALLRIDGKEFQALPQTYLEDRIKEADNPKGYRARSLANTVSAAVTIGAWQTVTGEMKLLGPIENRYGFDNERRKERLLRFAKRLLFPGDGTEGLLLFKSPLPADAAILEIPVQAFYDKSDRANIRIQLTKASQIKSSE